MSRSAAGRAISGILLEQHQRSPSDGTSFPLASVQQPSTLIGYFRSTHSFPYVALHTERRQREAWNLPSVAASTTCRPASSRPAARVFSTATMQRRLMGPAALSRAACTCLVWCVRAASVRFEAGIGHRCGISGCWKRAAAATAACSGAAAAVRCHRSHLAQTSAPLSSRTSTIS